MEKAKPLETIFHKMDTFVIFTNKIVLWQNKIKYIYLLQFNDFFSKHDIRHIPGYSILNSLLSLAVHVISNIKYWGSLDAVFLCYVYWGLGEEK